MTQPAEVLLNGQPVIGLSVFDRGLHYGDGLFETMVCIDGRVRWLDRHWQRLATGCERLHIACPPMAIVCEEIALLAGAAGRCIIKLLVTRGPATARGYQPGGDEQPSRLLLRYPWSASPDEGLRVAVSSVPLGENEWLAGLKHLNRLEQVLARQALAGSGLDEVVMVSQSGLATCGSMSNLFVFEPDVILTPELDRCGVAGVMRSLVLEAARSLGLPMRVESLDAQRVRAATALFMTNVRWGLRAVREFEGRLLATDQRLAALQGWIDARAG